MTFLATGEDTQGQFALIEAVGRKGDVPPPRGFGKTNHPESEQGRMLVVEAPYSEIQELIDVGAKYGIEFVLPKP